MTCLSCGAISDEGARFCRGCGRPLDALAPAAAAGGDRPWWRTSAGWRARWGRVLTVAVVGAVLAAAGVVWFRQSVTYPPEQPVHAWFAALAARDTAAAAAMSGAVLLEDGDLLGEGYTPPTDVQIGEVTYGQAVDHQRPNKTLAHVKVSYRLGEQLVEHSIEVNRDREGPVRPWSLGTGATGRLDIVAGPMQRASIGGQLVATLRKPRPAGTGADDGALTLPPGIYTVAGRDDDPLFTAAPVTVAVPAGRGERSASVKLALKVRPEAVAEIGKQVKARLAECAKVADPYPYGCPFTYSGGFLIQVTRAQWTIRRQPKVELVPVADPYEGGPLATLRTTSAGQARLTYAAYRTGGATATADVDFTVAGDIRLKDGALTWTGGKSGVKP